MANDFILGSPGRANEMFKCPHCGYKLRIREIDTEFPCPGCHNPLQSTQKRSAMFVILMFTLFVLVGGPIGILFVCKNMDCIIVYILSGILILILFYLHLIRIAPADEIDP